MLKNCLRRKSFLFFVWGSGRSVPDPFRSAEWGREGVDFAVERNGAGGVGAMAEAWYTGRPAGLVLGGPGCLGQAGVRGAGGPEQGGVRWASTPWAGRAEYMRRAIAECPGHEGLFHGVRAARELCQGRAGTPGAHISVLINGLQARVSPPKVADDCRSGGVTTPILQKMLRSGGVTTPKQCKFFDLGG